VRDERRGWRDRAGGNRESEREGCGREREREKWERGKEREGGGE